MTLIDANVVELELARKLFWLMKHDFIFFSGWNEDRQTWDEGTYPAIICNDIFVPGADAENLHLDDLDNYITVCKKFIKLNPEYLWCIAKRSQKPWRTYSELNAEELEALDYICKLIGTENPYTDSEKILDISQ